MAGPADTSAQRIRAALAGVADLRAAQQRRPDLTDATLAIKRLQNTRFATSYADLLQHEGYEAAARFFLDELYSDRDYTARDGQFARIAGTLQTLFPQKVVDTAVSLAELHALSEALDAEMALAWLSTAGTASPAQRYVVAWRQVGQRDRRQLQLSTVLRIGTELERLTRTPGLRLMLKMMRGPAGKAGMGALQQFLESGFDTFGALTRVRGGASTFLKTIEHRETALLALLFDGPPDDAIQTLAGWLRHPKSGTSP